MGRIIVGGLGVLGLILVALGAVLMGVGFLSAPDPWGFNRAIGFFGFLMFALGIILVAVGRAGSKRDQP